MISTHRPSAHHKILSHCTFIHSFILFLSPVFHLLTPFVSYSPSTASDPGRACLNLPTLLSKNLCLYTTNLYSEYIYKGFI